MSKKRIKQEVNHPNLISLENTLGTLLGLDEGDNLQRELVNIAQKPGNFEDLVKRIINLEAPDNTDVLIVAMLSLLDFEGQTVAPAFHQFLGAVTKHLNNNDQRYDIFTTGRSVKDSTPNDVLVSMIIYSSSRINIEGGFEKLINIILPNFDNIPPSST
jgi:hypothetical protein